MPRMAPQGCWDGKAYHAGVDRFFVFFFFRIPWVSSLEPIWITLWWWVIYKYDFPIKTSIYKGFSMAMWVITRWRPLQQDHHSCQDRRQQRDVEFDAVRCRAANRWVLWCPKGVNHSCPPWSRIQLEGTDPWKLLGISTPLEGTNQKFQS